MSNINLEEISKEDFNYLCSIFWKWDPLGVLDDKHTPSEKIEKAISLEQEASKISNQNELNIFNSKISEMINSNKSLSNNISSDIKNN